jgi:hypothetical protein
MPDQKGNESFIFVSCYSLANFQEMLSIIYVNHGNTSLALYRIAK